MTGTGIAEVQLSAATSDRSGAPRRQTVEEATEDKDVEAHRQNTIDAATEMTEDEVAELDHGTITTVAVDNTQATAQVAAGTTAGIEDMYLEGIE